MNIDPVPLVVIASDSGGDELQFGFGDYECVTLAQYQTLNG